MGKIFCIMGKSSSGKDTIFKLLNEEDTEGLKDVVIYTTRPKRNNETNGLEYYFIDKEELSMWKSKGKVIESRCYNTIYGEWHYSTIDDGQIELDKNNYLIIITLEAYIDLKKYYGDENVVPIYIGIDDGLRLQRALDREREEQNPKYDEMCRRYLADSKDFSKDNLEKAGITRIFENYNLDKAIDEIKLFIREQINY